MLRLVTSLVLRWPQGINAPNKEYWLQTPQRLRHFERLVREDLMLIGALTTLLFAAIILLLLAALAAGVAHVQLSAAQWAAWAATCLVGVLPFSALGLWLGTLVGGRGAPALRTGPWCDS